MTPKAALIAEEQSYFDRAWEAREASRAVLKEAPGAACGPAKGAAAVRRAANEAAERMGSPEDEVAFGRMDLDGHPWYVGKRAITDPDKDLLVINWQAPAAAPFYKASIGDTLGVTLRRTFRCRGNTINDFDDVIFADLVERVEELSSTERWGMDDAVLRDLELSRTGEMQDIVQTIHAAQYELIRKPLELLLVIQGGPGTGKTAVALHRVSWLLYDRPELSAQDILVIGPNRSFTQYIRSVLPGLGEEDVAHTDLQALGPQRATGRREDVASATLKGDSRMAELLATALYQRVRFPDRTATLDVGALPGSPRFTRDEIEAELRRHRRSTYADGRSAFRQYLTRESATRARRGLPVPASAVEAALERVWPSLTPQAFLRDLFGSRERLLAAAGELFNAAEVNLLFRPAAERITQEGWTDADVALLDEADQLINGLPTTYSHIVVDEAQDLSPMQLRSVRRRSVDGSMTVVGDLAQSTGAWARHSWEDVASGLVGDHPYEFQELSLGYRVPKQVFDFAAQLLPHVAPSVTPPTVVRQGPAQPELVHDDPWSLTLRAIDAAQAHAGNGHFVGLVCPEALREDIELEMSSRGVSWGDVARGDLGKAINLVSAQESKGLEFDAVVVADPGRIASESAWGLRLLYVALTRTTKFLTVVHSGDPLPLPKPLPSGEEGGAGQEPVGAVKVSAVPLAVATEPTAASSLEEREIPQVPQTMLRPELQGAVASFVANKLADDVRAAVPEALWPVVVAELRAALALSKE